MKAFLINLASRSDRLEEFKKNNDGKAEQFSVFKAIDGRDLDYSKLKEAGFDTDKFWRDPQLERVLTWGEIGCFLSHYKLWEHIALSEEPHLIIEDDAVLDKDLNEIVPYLGSHELLYLAHLEMKRNGVVALSDDLIRPCYPYHTTAYILTPSGARKLISTDIRHNIIPVDEYLPRMIDKLDVAAFKNQVAHQISRKQLGTDVEPRGEKDFVVDFDTHVLTCGDDESKMTKLTESAEKFGIKPVNILRGEWGGTDMRGPGGGQKLVDLKAYIENNNLPEHDVILFTDAFDVFYYSNLPTIVGRFLAMKTEVLFSAERWLWPDTSLQFPSSHTPYRYLNSGTFIGRVGEIRRMLDFPLENSQDDQLFLQKRFLSGRYDASLDYEGYIFCTNEDQAFRKGSAIYNPITGCHSCIYHGNGGEKAKAKFNELYESLYPALKYAHVKDYEVIGAEMLLVDCFTEDDCKRWIEISEKHGGWNPHWADKFPSHDIHIKELGLWDEWEDHWRRVIAPITSRYWIPTAHHHLRKAFTMKYSVDTQKTLGLHNDSSLVTGSMKLNDDYEGATLIFPRQGVTNADIPIGKMILFPGMVTHGHHVDELKSGTKYSLTTWTARYKGDLLDPA